MIVHLQTTVIVYEFPHKPLIFMLKTFGTTLAFFSSLKLLRHPSHSFQAQNIWDNPRSFIFKFKTSGTTLAFFSSSKLLGQPSHSFQVQKFWGNPRILFNFKLLGQPSHYFQVQNFWNNPRSFIFKFKTSGTTLALFSVACGWTLWRWLYRV